MQVRVCLTCASFPSRATVLRWVPGKQGLEAINHFSRACHQSKLLSCSRRLPGRTVALHPFTASHTSAGTAAVAVMPSCQRFFHQMVCWYVPYSELDVYPSLHSQDWIGNLLLFLCSALLLITYAAAAGFSVLSIPRTSCIYQSTLIWLLFVQRTWDLASNASSEPSEAAALYSSHGNSSLNMMMPSATSSVQAAASSQAAGNSDAVRQVVWSKGVPPSGKKKKDSAAAQRAVFTRLI